MTTIVATATHTGLIKDRDFYFDDGTVVLVAEHTIFRVYRGTLARQSKAIDNLFAGVPAGGSLTIVPGETIDGCPVVHCPDVTAYELRQFLHAIFDGLDHKGVDTTPFSVTAAQLTLGVRYEAPRLVSVANDRLCRLFPLTLQEWDHRAWCEDEEAIEAIDFLRGAGHLNMCVDVEEHLVAAFYLAAQLPEQVIRGGTARADGTPVRLSAEDVARVLELKAWLRERNSRVLAECSEHGTSGACEGWKCCRYLIEEMMYMGKPDRPEDPLDPDFVHEQIDRMDDGDDELGICPRCGQYLRRVFQRWRCALWDELPSVVYPDSDDDNDF